MRARRFGNEHVLAFEPGERVLETLTRYCAEQRISGARLSAIGGFSSVQLRYFDMRKKQYEQREVNEQVEVVGLLGNITLVDGKPHIHAHVALGTSDYRSYAGHLGEATAEPTLELFLTQLDGALVRQEDPRTDLEALRPDAHIVAGSHPLDSWRSPERCQPRMRRTTRSELSRRV